MHIRDGVCVFIQQLMFSSSLNVTQKHLMERLLVFCCKITLGLVWELFFFVSLQEVDRLEQLQSKLHSYSVLGLPKVPRQLSFHKNKWEEEEEEEANLLMEDSWQMLLDDSKVKHRQDPCCHMASVPPQVLADQHFPFCKLMFCLLLLCFLCHILCSGLCSCNKTSEAVYSQAAEQSCKFL